MAKSIRSKCKRKARAEFRRTIGEEAYQKNMAKVQEKLKDCVEKQSMKSLDRIANILDTSQEEEMETTAGTMVDVDALETVKDIRGENKAPVKKMSRKRKHSLKKKKPATKEVPPKRRPKYFVQF